MRASFCLVLALVAGCSVPDFFLVDGKGSSDGGQKDAGADAKPDAAIDAPPGAATVTGVTSSTADGYYKAAASITITVTFSAAVTVNTTGGTPRLTLNAGAGAYAIYASGTGTTTLTFTYTVAAGNASADLDYSSAGALSANGGTIKNGSIDSFLSLPTPGAAGSLGANKAIVIDAVAPTISAISGTNAYSPSSSASLAYTVTDANPLTTTCMQTAGTGTLASCTATGAMFTGLSEGAHTISITHTDAAGNTSSAQTYSWTVDTTAPVVSTISGPATYVQSSSASLTYTTTETNPGTTTCTQTAGTGTMGTCSTTGVSFTSLSEGAHTVTVVHTDLAGNASSTKTYSWTVDLTNPVVSTITGPNTYANSNSASFSYTVTETNPSTTSCTVDGSTSKVTSCTMTGAGASGLAEGAHTLVVTHTDLSGRTGTKNYSWTVDTVFPVVSITGLTNNWTAINSVSLPVSITETNPGTTTCTHPVGAGTQTACDATGVSYSNLGPGAHEIDVIHTDLAGNMTDQKYLFSYCPPINYLNPGGTTYTVPNAECGTTLDIFVWGGGGAGGANGGIGGGGGFGKGTLTVSTGQQFTILVGAGGAGLTGGSVGGGFGGNTGNIGGGGGAYSLFSQGGVDILRVGGGGGGGGCSSSAYGGVGGVSIGSFAGGSAQAGSGAQSGGPAGGGAGNGTNGGPNQGGNGGPGNCSGGGGGSGQFGGGGGGGAASASPGPGGGGGGCGVFAASLTNTASSFGTPGTISAGGTSDPHYVGGHALPGGPGNSGGDGMVVIHLHP